MARTITMDRQETKTNFGLARREDVNYDDIKKRWIESADKIELPQDPRTQEEIQAAEDFSQAAGFAEFFEMDVEISEMNAQESLDQMAAAMTMEAEAEIQIAREQRKKIIEEDAAEKIEQVETFTVNDDDPLLENDFKEKSEKLIQNLMIEDSKRDGTFETAKENKTSTSSTAYYGNSGSSNDSFSSNSRTTTATTSSTVFASDGKREQEVLQMYARSHDNILNAVHNAPKWKEEKKMTNINYFGGKKKFGLKSIWSNVKVQMASKKAKTICKIGVALCMEMALGIITKKQTFDGPGQMLGYLGMMLGVFYIGSELYAEGYDMRRLSVF